MRKLILMIVSCGVLSLAHADDNALNNFLANAKTIKADFTQTVVTGKKSRVTTGTMEIQRPNKFRWEYIKDQQLIVSDSKNIYIYDKPLQQVTVKSLGQSIDKSPAALLAGANNIKSLYNISDYKSGGDNLQWVKVEPKSSADNNGFQTVLMGFGSDGKIAAMQFVDTFGNKTSLKFSNVQTAVTIPASDFQFTPPKGVDVLQQ
ncbi:MAG: outer membrane lipoprotein carrier protein LolA [Proteobacteria bacterium]|nr:MAG: outer membrane lipoprotein carrier protein LolA [Pseudomonadota bacterium]